MLCLYSTLKFFRHKVKYEDGSTKLKIDSLLYAFFKYYVFIQRIQTCHRISIIKVVTFVFLNFDILQ